VICRATPPAAGICQMPPNNVKAIDWPSGAHVGSDAPQVVRSLEAAASESPLWRAHTVRHSAAKIAIVTSFGFMG
jgi:hypothetical protein